MPVRFPDDNPRNQAMLIECVGDVQKRTNATVLFVAHDMNPLLGVMDRVFYVAGGSALLGVVFGLQLLLRFEARHLLRVWRHRAHL